MPGVQLKRHKYESSNGCEDWKRSLLSATTFCTFVREFSPLEVRTGWTKNGVTLRALVIVLGPIPRKSSLDEAPQPLKSGRRLILRNGCIFGTL